MENKPEHKHSGLHYIVLIFFILLAAGLGYELFILKRNSSLSTHPAEKQETIVSINVLPLAAQNVTFSKHYIGYVTPVHSVSVLPFINGFIESVHVRSGQFVKAGQLLAVLEQGEYKANLQLAHASVMQAKANYENADIYYKRIQTAGQNAVSQADKDKAYADYLSTKASLAQAQAQLSAAEVNFNYTIIRAPISGLIGTVTPTKGDYVSPAGTPLMTILQTSPIQVVFSVTDKDYIQSVMENGLSDLLAGKKIRLQLANGEFYPIEGVYQYAENALDKGTNSVAVYVDFENKDNILIPNAYVTVYLEQELKNILRIPQNLVSLTPQGNFIAIANTNGVHQKKIEIVGIQDADYIIKNTFAPQSYLVIGKPPVLKENEQFKLNILSDNAG